MGETMKTVMKLTPVVDAAEILSSILGGTAVKWAYLKSYDIEAHGGRGEVLTTYDINKALRFDSQAAAMLAWKTQSKVQPLRDDGRPNRPLTAFSATFEQVPS
jgi:hypothetical protein